MTITNPEVPVMNNSGDAMYCYNSKEKFQLLLNVPVYDISSRKIALMLVTKVVDL